MKGPKHIDGDVQMNSPGLKISTLGGTSFATLSADMDICYPIGTSVRIVGGG